MISIVTQLNPTQLHRIDSIKVTFNRLTIMLCDDSESNESNRTQRRIDSNKTRLNRLAMMLCDDGH